MPRLRVHNIAMSLDGYAAGPDQSLENPLGVGGERLHEWAFASMAWREAHGLAGGDSGGGSGGDMDGDTGGGARVDNDFMARGDAGIGATIMGRNMFGPIRGDWGDKTWTGWWGDDPPYHQPVFVLTHHPRESLEMAGGTTFHFVTDGIHAALEQAFDAAAGADVRIGGGASVIRQYLDAGLVDELHVAIAPVLLGDGERLFGRGSGHPAQYEVTSLASSAYVAHIQLSRAAAPPG